MSDTPRKPSVWERMRHPRELRELREEGSARPDHPQAVPLSAMEIELRALRARPDAAFGAAVSALSGSTPTRR